MPHNPLIFSFYVLCSEITVGIEALCAACEMTERIGTTDHRYDYGSEQNETRVMVILWCGTRQGGRSTITVRNIGG